MRIKCVIADDELPARQGLAALLGDFPDIDVVAICADGVAAIDAIREHKPDLVLLDVQMPHVDGFEVLASIETPRPQVIFITAFDEFALKAFEVNAVDYLLKPFNDERFAESIERVREKLGRVGEEDGVEGLIRSVSRRELRPVAPLSDDRLVLRVDGNVHLIPYAKVVYIEAYDYYVKVHSEGNFLLVRETMKNLEDLLPSTMFLRIHKSYIVNLQWVRALSKRSNEHVLQLVTEEELRVSRSKLSTVREFLQGPA